MRIALPFSGRVPIPPVKYGNRQPYEMLLEFQRLGHDVFLINDRNGSSEWRYMAGLPRKIERLDPDVVHCHQAETAVALGLLGIPHIYTPWAVAFILERLRRWYQVSGMVRDRLALATAEMITAPTETIQEMLTERGYGPITHVPLSVDTEKFKARTDGTPGLALGLGIIDRRKRWEIAVAGLRGTGARLRIVGPERDPAYGRELRQDGVEIVGEVSEERLLGELEECGFLVHPAAVEAFPGAVLQAMSFSRPVIAGAVCAHIPSLGVEKAPSDRPGDVEKTIHETALMFAGDEARRKEYGRHNRRVVLADYSTEVVAKKYLEVYRRFARGAS
jgi:glycosyltransferase involved in cell wall biosynthesis